MKVGGGEIGDEEYGLKGIDDLEGGWMWDNNHIQGIQSGGSIHVINLLTSGVFSVNTMQCF